MRTPKSIIAILSMLAFMVSISTFTACGNSKKGQKVKSGSGMGNKKDKNKHVWGK